jgi:mono/diheme cytochrome c family protein
MCHGERGSGASLRAEGYLAGGSILGSGWYAPPLNANSLNRFSNAELAEYLRSGISKHGSAYGPMADVTYRSLYGLTTEDAASIAEYLKGLPPHAERPSVRRDVKFVQTSDSGGNSGDQIYKKLCSDCHGDDGEGKEDRYPPLNDSVAVTAPDAVNAVRMVLYGAMAPTTPGDPRPYSMPPFAQQLSDADVAAVVNYIRRNSTPPSQLTAVDIERMHGIVFE